jgi:hypothetical protein
MYIEGPHDDTGIPTAFGFRSANCLFAIEEYLSTRETAEVLDHRSSRSGSQLTMPYAPTTVPLAGAGPLVQRSLMAETNSPNAGSAVSGL